MPISTFERVTAVRLQRLKSKKYWAQTSGTVPASSAGVDVPGCSIPITVETAADLHILWFADFDMTGAGTATGSVRALVDAVGSPTYALFAGEVTTDRMSPGASWLYTVPAAGTYTVKLLGTTTANQTVNVYTTLTVEVHEVV